MTAANAHIFREYDIRGVADRDLPDATCHAIGRALGEVYRARGMRRIAVGQDCRLSSPRIHAALCAGLRRTGINIVDIGIGPSPLLYFAVFALDLDGGIQITGSHNPPDENGVKMMIGKKPLFGADIQTLRAMVLDSTALTPDAPSLGAVEFVDVTDMYVEHIVASTKLERTDLRFAVDAGNGAGGPLAKRTLEALGLSPMTLLCEMDGRFPVHHPDPTEPETLRDLQRAIEEHNLDFGVAYDGDADRIGVVDQRGDIVWGDKLMIAFARSVLEANPGAAILGEVKCSQTLYDDIAKHGGRPILWKTGHSLIKTKMAEEGALLAGEMSGHIFFSDRYFGFDDAIYATVRLVEILARTKQQLHELLSDVPKTFTTPELRVPCADSLKFAVVERVLAHYRPTNELVDIDGARVQFEGGWGLVRASNTQPVLVLRFEAQTEAQLLAIRGEVERVVERSVNELSP